MGEARRLLAHTANSLGLVFPLSGVQLLCVAENILEETFEANLLHRKPSPARVFRFLVLS